MTSWVLTKVTHQGEQQDPLRIATLGEIFETKAFVCSECSKTRDWLDLYLLLTEHGYTMKDVYAVYQRIDRLPAFAIPQMRLRSCQPEKTDEGYDHLLDRAPSLKEMCTYFNQKLDELEVMLVTGRRVKPH